MKKASAEEAKRGVIMMEMVRELGITNANELYTALRGMFAGTLEDMLKAELDGHLGYEKHDQQPKETSNRRNGVTSKKLRTAGGMREDRTASRHVRNCQPTPARRMDIRPILP